MKDHATHDSNNCFFLITKITHCLENYRNAAKQKEENENCPSCYSHKTTINILASRYTSTQGKMIISDYHIVIIFMSCFVFAPKMYHEHILLVHKFMVFNY